METDASTPNAPIDLQLLSKTSNSVKLSWKQNKEPMAHLFNLQYRLQMLDEGGMNDIDSNHNAML